MGQIVGGAAKPKRCNLNRLSQLVTPAAGEYILVSSDNSMNAAGQGNFDCYIEGDGSTPANQLDVNDLQGLIEISKIEITDLVSGYYLKASSIGASATRTSASNCSYSRPVRVKEEDVVHCVHQGTGIACICTTDANASAYTAVALSSNNTGTVESTYTVASDGYIAVSSRTEALDAWVIRKMEKYLSSDSVVSEMIEDSDNPIASGTVKSAYDTLNSKIDEVLGATILYDDSIWTISGRYITTSGSTTTSNDWSISKPIRLKEGWTITLNTQGSSVCAIAQTDISSSSYTPLVTIPANVSGNKPYTYTADGEIYVAMSGKTASNDVTASLVIPSSIKSGEDIIDDDFEYTDGFYISSAGAKVKSSNCSYSKPKKVYAGDKVVMYSQGSSISAISTTTSEYAETGTITSVEMSTNSSGYIKHEYAVENDGYIIVSSRTAAFTEYPPYILRGLNGLFKSAAKSSLVDNDVLNVKDEATYNFVWEQGYITLKGIVSDLAGHTPRHCQPIYIEAGNMIRVRTRLFGGIIIARTDANMSYIFPLRTSSLKESDTSGGGMLVYEYVVTNSGYYTISKYADDDNTAKIIPISNKLEETSSVSIINRYADGEIRRRVRAELNYDEWGADFKAFFFSDVHGSIDNLSRIIELAESYGSDVDCIINGGDTTTKNYSSLDNISWYNNILNSTSVEIIGCIGNHDADNASSPVDVYNALISVPASYSGVVAPSDAASSGKCYYYKDYNGVRVIILDATIGHGYWDSAEESWLISALADAKANDLHVICVNHCGEYPNWRGITKYNSGFASKSAEGLNGASLHVKNEALSAVQDFIDGGGDFVCWLFGHTHWDDFYTITGYPDQMCFVTTSARFNYDYTMARSGNIKFADYDAFNYLGVVKRAKILKLGRFGLNHNSWFEPKNGFVFDYGNHQLLATS